MRIIRMAAGDEAQVLQAGSLFDAPPDVEAVRAFLADTRNYLHIAYVDGRPAGFTRAHELNGLKTLRLQMFLYEIAVAEPYRRRGVARALIGALERICRERGFREMFVITNDSNLAARALYASTGGRREADDDVVFVYDYESKGEP